MNPPNPTKPALAAALAWEDALAAFDAMALTANAQHALTGEESRAIAAARAVFMSRRAHAMWAALDAMFGFRALRKDGTTLRDQLAEAMGKDHAAMAEAVRRYIGGHND